MGTRESVWRVLRRGLVVANEHPHRLALAFGALLYAFWATEMTWPLLDSPAHNVLGGLGDQTGGIAYLREQLQDGVFPFFPGTLHDLNAPEGLDINWGVNLSSWPWILPTWLIGLVSGPIAGYAIVDWLGLVLSGVAMQILATRLTRSTVAGLVAGFAFAFYPYALTKAATHPAFAHGWPLALMAWRHLELFEAPTRRNLVLAAAASVFALAFTSYYVLIGGALLAMCVVLAVVAAWRRGGRTALRVQARAQAVVVGVVVVYLGALAALTLGGGGGALRTNDPSFVVRYSARIHEFFVPFGRNIVLGDTTSPWLQQRQHGSNFSETTLYLGIVVLALALVGVVAAALRRTPARLRWGLLVALVVAVGGVVWSAPPHVNVGPLTVPTPSRFVSEITSTWRVYSRFVVVVMLGASLMAAVGVAALTRGRRPWVSALVGAVALAGVAADFWWRPGALALQDPPVYRILREHPGGIVAQYPLLPAGFGDSSDVLWQDAGGHPVLNGYSEDSYEDRRASTLYSLQRAATARGLASLGVRYVVLPENDPMYASTSYPGPAGTGFDRLGSGKYGAETATVYSVTARPDAGYVYLVAGVGGPEGDPNDDLQWMTSADAQIDVDAPRCPEPCHGRLRLHMTSLGAVRDVTLEIPGGRTVWRGKVPPEGMDVTVPLIVTGHAEISVHADPGPVPIPQVIPGSQDQRSVAVAFARLRYTR
jgi:hypothetical protein